MRNAYIVGILAVALLGGCRNLAPPHVLPDAPVPGRYPPEYSGDAASGTPAAEIAWRDFFADERLEALIAAALTNNRDLAVAVARIEEARGFYRIQEAARLPEAGVSADAARSRGGAGVGSQTFNRFSVGVGVSAFELDFWGRVRNLTESARAQFLSTVAAERAFRLALVRDVAAAYLASREAAERIALAEATVRSRQEGLRIARVRLDAGVTSALDFRQSESLLMQAETELAGLRLARARADNAVAFLVGAPLAEPLPEPLPLARQAGTFTLAPGLPSELLAARPDILAAEEQLRASRADIGAARAAFFPSIGLTGSLGFASAELDELVGSDGLTWSFGPFLNLPIFNRGRLRGNLAVTQARERIALANYERAIQTAFREVADALAGRRYLAEQVAAQERSTQAQRQIAELAQTRYREGVVGYIEVLDAERNLFTAEQVLVQLRRAEVENLVALYVVLGGGEAEEP